MATTEPTPQNPSSDYDDILTSHNYDGIEEYDNPMPSWWILTFYLTIAWAGFYVIGISTGAIDDYTADLKEGKAEIEDIRQRHALKNARPEVTSDVILGVLTDSTRVQGGAEVFKANCAACHGDKGQGLIGPNLTDMYWLHGAEPTKVLKSIDKGIVAKGMPAWGPILSPDDVLNVTAFVLSTQGSNPAGAKAKQGKESKIKYK